MAGLCTLRYNPDKAGHGREPGRRAGYASKVIARARNLTHLFELRSRGIDLIERETFDSALLIGQHAMEQLGIDHETAERARIKFREHNLATVDAIFPIYRDASAMISIAQAARDQLARSFEHDRIRLGDGQ